MSFGKKLIPFYVAIALIALILYLIYKPSPEGIYEDYDEAKAVLMDDGDLIEQQIVGESEDNSNFFIVYMDDSTTQDPHYAFACFSKKQNDEVVWHGSSNYFYGGGESTAIKSPCFDEEDWYMYQTDVAADKPFEGYPIAEGVLKSGNDRPDVRYWIVEE